jgi:hypothetical protein
LTVAITVVTCTTSRSIAKSCISRREREKERGREVRRGKIYQHASETTTPTSFQIICATVDRNTLSTSTNTTTDDDETAATTEETETNGTTTDG